MRPVDFFRHARQVKRRRVELIGEVKKQGVIDTTLNNPVVYSKHITLIGSEGEYKL